MALLAVCVKTILTAFKPLPGEATYIVHVSTQAIRTAQSGGHSWPLLQDWEMYLNGSLVNTRQAAILQTIPPAITSASPWWTLTAMDTAGPCLYHSTDAAH